MEPMEATFANMHEHYSPGVLAFSPLTGEEYSANPRDYFMWSGDDEDTPLVDSAGEPMLLVRKVTTFEPVT